MRRFISVLLLLMNSIAIAQIQLSVATEYPQSAMPGEGVTLFSRLVNERSLGRLVLAASFDASNGIKSAQMIAAVSSRKVDIGDSYLPSLAAMNPLFSLSALPFVVSTIDEAKRLTDASRSAYEQLLLNVGVKLLYTTPWPASGVWSVKALSTGSDVASLKIRTYDSTSQRSMAAVTASAVNVSFADVMPMLKEGQVNAVLSSGDGGAGRKLWEFLPHFTEINYAMPISATVINLALFNSLEPSQQVALLGAAEQTERSLWQLIRQRLQQNYITMRSNGVQINEQRDPALLSALSKGAQSTIEEWKTAVTAADRKLLSDFQSSR
jgi:TRAP-type transport system periplasmic protein